MFLQQFKQIAYHRRQSGKIAGDRGSPVKFLHVIRALFA
jgi:hypothetical protein